MRIGGHELVLVIGRNHVVRWRGDLGEPAHPVLGIPDAAERARAPAQARSAAQAPGWTEGSAHMSEGPAGGHDSRPEDPVSSQDAPDSVPVNGADTHQLYKRGLDLLGRGSPAAAAQLLERAAAAEPRSRSVLEALARAQFDAGQYAAAAGQLPPHRRGQPHRRLCPVRPRPRAGPHRRPRRRGRAPRAGRGHAAQSAPLHRRTAQRPGHAAGRSAMRRQGGTR